MLQLLQYCLQNHITLLTWMISDVRKIQANVFARLFMWTIPQWPVQLWQFGFIMTWTVVLLLCELWFWRSSCFFWIRFITSCSQSCIIQILNGNRKHINPLSVDSLLICHNWFWTHEHIYWKEYGGSSIPLGISFDTEISSQ